MRRLPGQAAQYLAQYLWGLLHRLLKLCLGIAMLASVALGLLAWRLSQGPLELAWLASQLEAVANSETTTRIHIGSAALAWEGFRGGVDRPLDIRLRDITANDAAGVLVFALPMADISLSLRGLLLGRVEPRAIELRNAQLRAQRRRDGTLSIDLDTLVDATQADSAPVGTDAAAPAAGMGLINALLAELAQPATNDLSAFRNHRFSQLRRIVISRAALTVVDHQLGNTWQAAPVDIDLQRRSGGGVDGTAEIVLAMGEERARLSLTMALDAADGSGHAVARLSPIAPAALARLSPALAMLAAVDAAISLEARLELGPALAIRQGMLEATLGPGQLVLGNAKITVRQATARIEITPEHAQLRALRVELAAHADGPASVLEATGTLGQENGLLRLRGQVAVDQVAFADLPVLWPPGMARNAREWVTRNITTGTAQKVLLDIGLTANPDLSNIHLAAITGGFQAEELTVHWLRPVPPIERIKARVAITDPDVLDVFTEAGRQVLDGPRGAAASGLVAPSGHVRITGLAQQDQIAQIDVDFNGPVAEVISLLRHPRLRLLDRSPFELKEPAGSLTSHLRLTVPLEHNLTFEDVTIHALAQTTGLRLAGLVAGRDLEQGALALDVTTEVMKITGRAMIAAIPVQLTADLDFRPGGPGQTQQRITALARADVLQLAKAAGLDLTGLATGPAAAQIAYARRRDGSADVRINGELRDSELQFTPLAWRKPPGRTATLEARLRIQRDRILSVDDLVVSGEGIDLRGRVEQIEGRLALLRLHRAVLGRTESQGTVEFQANGTTNATMQGTVVDLAPRMTAPPVAPQRQASTPERPWRVQAQFTTALMAHEVRINGFSLRADSDGGIIRRMRVEGQAGAGAMHMEISPPASPGTGTGTGTGTSTGGRRFTAAAADAAVVLQGMDIAARKLAGGQLRIDAVYDDRAPDRPLIGTARIDDFRVLNAPAVTNVLQAMTFYGLLQMAQGPGLAITKLIAPFRMTDEILTLHDVRAFNPSLGLTIAGKIDRIRETCDMSGTVVPAYFFNSLLGDLPLVGRLFAPEAGGGLFAANYTLRGKLTDPEVTVNPLSALTPGFLRGLFGGF